MPRPLPHFARQPPQPMKWSSRSMKVRVCAEKQSQRARRSMGDPGQPLGSFIMIKQVNTPMTREESNRILRKFSVCYICSWSASISV